MSRNSHCMYQSTRDVSGTAPDRGFRNVLYEGLAPDGGLFMPKELPDFSKRIDELMGYVKTGGYHLLAFHIVRPFISIEECPDEDLSALIAKAYKMDETHGFRAENVVQFKTVDMTVQDDVLGINKERLPAKIDFLELFHGPTFAFKDVALQLLGVFFDYFYDAKTDARPLMVLGATSGDTGGAAMSGISACDNVKCVILYPLGGTSCTQEHQMISIAETSPNLQAIAVKDSCFDDCQTMVKEMFMTDKAHYRLMAVNSINWCRIMAQMVYYWFTALSYKLEGRPEPTIVVPTGNFGNILAGWYAQRMGAPIHKLVIASNSNNILTRCHKSGVYKQEPVTKTHSPSMDIGISSNFERLVYALHGHDADVTLDKFDRFKAEKSFSMEHKAQEALLAQFAAYDANDAQTEELMRLFKDSLSYSICPHTAVGVAAALMYASEMDDTTHPLVVAATAMAAKFPNAWECAGVQGDLEVPKSLVLPANYASKRTVIENSVDAVRHVIKEMI